jgi:hypothetical protein
MLSRATTVQKSVISAQAHRKTVGEIHEGNDKDGLQQLRYAPARGHGGGFFHGIWLQVGHWSFSLEDGLT